MKPRRLACITAICGFGLVPTGPADAQGARVRDCVPAGQARDVLVSQRLVAPFRAFGEALRSGQGEPVGLQICRLGDDFVYDVTLLGRDGRVTHMLINGRSGSLIPAARSGK